MYMYSCIRICGQQPNCDKSVNILVFIALAEVNMYGLEGNSLGPTAYSLKYNNAAWFVVVTVYRKQTVLSINVKNRNKQNSDHFHRRSLRDLWQKLNFIILWLKVQKKQRTYQTARVDTVEVPPVQRYRSHTFVHIWHWTYDLWPWKPFQQFPLTWWIFVASVIRISPLSTELSRHAK